MSKAKRASEAAKRQAAREAAEKAAAARLAAKEKAAAEVAARRVEKAAAGVQKAAASVQRAQEAADKAKEKAAAEKASPAADPKRLEKAETAVQKTEKALQKAREAYDKAEAGYKKTVEATEAAEIKKAMEATEKEAKKAQSAAYSSDKALKDAAASEDANLDARLGDFEITHEIAAGVDVHKDMLAVTVLGNGKPLSFECGTLKDELDELAATLKGLGVQCVLMESTGVYWKEPFRRLQAAGLNVVVGNARHIKNVPGRKTDTADSRWLANLARFGMVRPSRVLSQEMDEVRDLSRVRQSFVEERARIKNRIVKLLVKGGFNVGQVTTDIFGTSGMITVRGLLNDKSPLGILSDIVSECGWRLKSPKKKLLDAIKGKMTEDLKILIRTLLDAMVRLGETIGLLEDRLERRQLETGSEESMKLLETIPGMSTVCSMTILAELGGGVSGFRSAGALSSWAGMCPGNNESAGKRKSGRTLFGNKRLKRALCEAGWAATRTNCSLRTSGTA